MNLKLKVVSQKTILHCRPTFKYVYMYVKVGFCLQNIVLKTNKNASINH